ILIDDMIDTAGTITLAAQALKDAGAVEVYVCATHPVFSGPAIERIEKSPIKEMVITDSINLPEDKKIDKVVQVSVGPLIGDAIKRIHEHKRSEEHTSELQSRFDLVCRLLLEKKKKNNT